MTVFVSSFKVQGRVSYEADICEPVAAFMPLAGLVQRDFEPAELFQECPLKIKRRWGTARGWPRFAGFTRTVNNGSANSIEDRVVQHSLARR
jgi:hypothetical protein